MIGDSHSVQTESSSSAQSYAGKGGTWTTYLIAKNIGTDILKSQESSDDEEKEEDEEDEETYLEKDAPDEYICPISMKLMRDPVVAPDGRVSRQQWK